jgi:hypothetical protein
VTTDDSRRSFWTTLPGIISGTAGLLAAIAALVGALATLGVVGGSEEPAGAVRQGPDDLDRVTFTWTAEFHEGTTRFTNAEVRSVPGGSLIALTCDGDGCFDGTLERRVPDATGAESVKDLLPRRLGPDANLQVRFTHPKVGTKLWRLTTDRYGLPLKELSCLPPGETVPEEC